MNHRNGTSVCVPVCAARAGELRAAALRAGESADVVELRFDCLEESESGGARAALGGLLRDTPLRFIITNRPAGQGGGRALELSERVGFWRETSALLRDVGAQAGAEDSKARVWADVELDLLESPRAEELRGLLEGLTLVCSHHDFERTPADIDAIYERMRRTRAHVLKFAARAGEITDCVGVLKLVGRARRDGVGIIAVSMGEAGVLTRVLAPAFGAALTYGSLEVGHETAPGQTTARDLRELYRVRSLDAETAVTGLVGSPVSHSLSPHIHNAAFAALGLNAVYVPFEVSDVTAFVRRMARPGTREVGWNLRGFSVTAPHKRAVVELLDWVEPAASEVGAVNTVLVEGESLRGYNTDARAALAPLGEEFELKDARVAVVGAGGAARALLWALRERGAGAVLFARDTEKARATAEAFGASVEKLEGACFEGFDLVVNATPLGTRGAREGETPADAAQLRGARAAYDLVYNPERTRFLEEARAAGCATFGGLGMLVAQAAAQFEIWTGRPAPFEVMRAAALARLNGA